MEDIIKQVAKYVLEKKFPTIDIEGVEITKERDFNSHYIDDKKNFRYNVFILFHNESDFDAWVKNESEFNDIKELIKDAVKAVGIYNKIYVWWDYVND